MSSGLMLDNIIMNLLSDTTEKEEFSENDLFSKIKDDKIYLYLGSLQDYSWKKIAEKKIHYVHIILLKNRN